ncbi:GbpC/Spa domain-containing protein [Ligilactobacillus agilis]|nr:GbpC/Spa domain-containing protein [Ligilactobacillus agilis]
MCKTTYDEVKSDYHDQVTKVNQVVTDYQKEYQAYLAKVAASGKDVVSSSQVVQQLTIQSEPQANLAISDIKGTLLKNERKDSFSFNKVDKMGGGYELRFGGDSSFTATYSNLKNVTYQGRKINKITVNMTIFKNSNDDFVLNIIDNPYYGWQFFNGYMSANYKFYYEDGSQVNFEKGTAYLAPASLNNYMNVKNIFSIETVEVVSGGQALGLYGSSVTAHGNKLYADKANSYDANGKSVAVTEWGPVSSDNVTSNAKEITNSNIPNDWDTVNSNYRYYGAGLIALSGNEATFKIYIQNNLAPANLPKGNEYTDGWRNMWYNVGTVIPETPGIPNKPTVSYNYSTVAANRLISRKTSR